MSLATLQNIEADKANPEIGTMHSVCEALGLELTVVPKQVDWAELAKIGVPLAQSEQSTAPALEIIKTINSHAASIARLSSDTRENCALVSWLCAIRDHYPTVWGHIAEPIRQWTDSFAPFLLSPGLRRLAFERLKDL